MSYKDTLHLPKTEMPTHINLPVEEPAVYKAWDDAKVFNRMKRDGVNPYVLHDGPPYANGNIHIGHALNKILKDFAVKFQYFNGRAVEFVPGWDCHGLPIEQQVHKLTRLSGVNPDPQDFLHMCRKYASEQVSMQMEQFKTLGVLADWDNRYETMSPEFEEMIAARSKQLYDTGFLIRRKKPVFWSWPYQTALAEAEVEYRDKVDEAVYLRFPNAARFEIDKVPESSGFLAWTTTPWTLPANVALAVSPELKYCLASSNKHSYLLYIANDAFDRLHELGVVEHRVCDNDGPILYSYDDFKDMKLVHPAYPDQTVPIVAANFVTANKGTGCVHIAPGHGEDDYLLALQYDLPIVMPVGPNARYAEGKYGPSEDHPDGLWIFEDDSNKSLGAKKDGTYQECSYGSNKIILNDLQANGLLVHTEKITHSYPYCSRSDTPVIFRATEQWFLDLDKIRNLPNNHLSSLKDVEFIPDNSKNRLFPMLEGRPDWCISRQRLWGVPILEGKEILDVWFDSGLSWNILGGRQADLYLEGNDQHRGWFQSSLWLSVALAGQAPYKKVITHGFVVDQNGEKMAKSKGNVVSPAEVVEKLGAEVLRYWVASTDYTKEVQCSQEILKNSVVGFKKLRNTFRFLVANLPAEKPEFPQRIVRVDEWILAVSAEVFAEIHSLFEQNLYYSGMQKLNEFITRDLSGIYMNAVKDRLYCGTPENRNSAIYAMSEILKSMLGLVAPLFTFTAQEIFSYMPVWTKGDAKDIFDVTYNPISTTERILSNIKYMEFWKDALEAFHVEFAKLRSDGKVKDTLEVGVEEGDGEFVDFGAEWFGVSWVFMETEREPLAEFSVGKTKFKIVKSEHKKCERCWQRNAGYTEGSELCERCRHLLYNTI